MNKMKKFWTLDWHQADGFTLVELIVVIAILAILGGVAIPVYSGYIKRANMGADETLIAQMKYAATLSTYEHDYEGTAVVKVTANGAIVVDPTTADGKALEAAMVKAFGDNWEEACKLKYDSWDVAANDALAKYQSTSLAGKEPNLLETMGSLTQSMNDFFQTKNLNKLPPEMKKVLAENGVDVGNLQNADPTAVANAAVLTLAQTLNKDNLSKEMLDKDGNKTTVEECVTDALLQVGTLQPMEDENGDIILNDDGSLKFDFTSIGNDLTASYDEIYGENSYMSSLATAATLYSYAESYAQYAANLETPNNKPMEILHGIEFKTDASVGEILEQIQGAFEDIMNDAASSAGRVSANSWFTGGANAQATKDTIALFGAMEALNDASDVLADNLYSSTFYTDGTAAGLVNAYLAIGNLIGAGEAAVIVQEGNSVVVYLGGLQN